VKDVQLNDKSLNRIYVTHEELMQGGKLKLVLVFSSETEAEWSRRALRTPFSGTIVR
jgi:putative alpha-1,2-mannosidase